MNTSIIETVFVLVFCIMPPGGSCSIEEFTSFERKDCLSFRESHGAMIKEINPPGTQLRVFRNCEMEEREITNEGSSDGQ